MTTATQHEIVCSLAMEVALLSAEANNILLKMLGKEAREHISGNLAGDPGVAAAQAKLRKALQKLDNVAALETCFPDAPVSYAENGEWVKAGAA